MEALNRTLFVWLAAPARPDAVLLALAIFFAEVLVWAAPALLAAGWLRGDERTRKTVLVAAVSGVLGLAVNLLIARVWPHPRPFMVGLGHNLIHHRAGASFPSDHLSAWWAMTFSLLADARWRRPAAVLALLGLPMAWARVYLGVHFPFDMVGSAAVGACSAWIARREARWYLDRAFGGVLRLHRALFAPLIARGWLRG